MCAVCTFHLIFVSAVLLLLASLRFGGTEKIQQKRRAQTKQNKKWLLIRESQICFRKYTQLYGRVDAAHYGHAYFYSNKPTKREERKKSDHNTTLSMYEGSMQKPNTLDEYEKFSSPDSC